MDNLINLTNVTNQMDGLFDVPPVWLDLLLSVCGMVRYRRRLSMRRLRRL